MNSENENKKSIRIYDVSVPKKNSDYDIHIVDKEYHTPIY